MRTALRLAAVLLFPAVALGADERIEAITKPSKDVILSFVRPGRVAEVLVKEGDKVKAGQVLVRLDDEAEQEQLAQLKADAEDEVHLKAAEAKLAQAKVDLKKMEEAFQKKAATELEIEHARLDMIISELSLALTRFEQSQKKRKFREATIRIEQMKMLCPIDGIVERVLVEPGESADALERIVQVVSIDPLWVDVPVALSVARDLKRGTDNAVVEFESRQADRPVRSPGTIAHIAAVADSASGTLTVRVEVPNKASRPAGEHVYVSFSQTKKVAKSTSPRRRVAERAEP